MLKRIFFIFSFLFSCFSVAQTANGDSQHQMSDPIEPINRLIWDFNYQVLDVYIYRPVTQSYVDWVPGKGRQAINNFVHNFDEPSTMVNNLVQLELKHSVRALFRFSVNSTFGLLGFLDVAEKMGVERRRETFSNVLGRWSVPNGPYLMLPVLGPSSTRKLVGNVVDGLYFPGSYFTTWQTYTLMGLDGLDKRESVLGKEPLLEQSLDPYIYIKETYIQYEAFKFYSHNENINQSMQPKSQQKKETLNADLEDFMDEIN
ncbi:VacJ family lipoprotein [Psychromonas antarctica]|uniref:MlaA family lipoprotein n=1 Tax=Psychromonas antarctica TaxID=67573 RepID=UPI001EE89CD1|nr:VacJ family lipoprotein [Psychromonas antarctica]MCG6199808.1 VacJ family lipoprotein [Psychromonas antarctica]